MPKHTPEGWTREDQAAWNRLRVRFPGLEEDIERLTLKVSVMTGHAAHTRIHYECAEGGFVAFIEAFSLLFDKGMDPQRYPVIPDEFNPNKDKKITPEMLPHPFGSYEECRRVAEQAELVLLKSLRAAEKQLFAEAATLVKKRKS